VGSESDVISRTKKTVQLWTRDQAALRDVRANPHTLRQLALLHFPSRNKAAHRMKQLHDAGFVKRTPFTCPQKQGKPEFVYFDKHAESKLPLHALDHNLAINDVRTALHRCVQTVAHFQDVFLYPCQLTAPALHRHGIIPDAVWCLRNHTLHKDILHFIEVDYGSEEVRGAPSRYAFEDKLDKYAAYFDSGGYRDFGLHIHGFRVLVFAEDATRMQQLLKLSVEKQCTFFWFSKLSWGVLNPLGAIWWAGGAGALPLVSRC
jgi:hypothetical protein